MSQLHTSIDPDPLPMAKSILLGDCADTLKETTEAIAKSTAFTCIRDNKKQIMRQKSKRRITKERSLR